MTEKLRHQPQLPKKESRAHSMAHRYDFKKMTSVVNHIDYARHHGYESAHRGQQLRGK